MSDDDKKGPDSDPWANLDAETPNEAGDAFSFAFDGLDDAPAADAPVNDAAGADAPAASGEDADMPALSLPEGHDTEAVAAGSPETDSWDALVADSIADAPPAREIPLAVFPPPDSEIAVGEGFADGFGDIDADAVDGASTVAEPAEAESPFAGEPSGIIAIADITTGFGEADPSTDDDLSAGLVSEGHSSAAADAFDHDEFDEAALAREMALGVAGESADFGDNPSESVSEDVSFYAGSVNAPSPFAEAGSADTFAPVDESVEEEAASIPMMAGMATAGSIAAATAGSIAAGAVRPVAAPKKKGSGIGQLIGIVLGGLLAIPIAFAILIWGFQKDPFKFANQVPPQLAFLLPQKLQPGATKPAAKTKKSGPDLSQAKSLDDLAVADGGDAAAPAVGDAEDAAAKPAAEDVAAAAAEPADTAEDGVPKPAMQPGDKDVAVPVPDALAALDPVATVAVAAPEPPLDLGGVEAAAAKAAQAFDSLAAVPDVADPARRKLLVGWYRHLAHLGEELALLEHAATGSGRPLDDTPEAASGVLERVRGDDAAVGDLVQLGSMWITSQKRQSDGVILVATVENVRRVGPYWSTRAAIADGDDDGTTRSVAIISRTQPAADVGDRVLVSGVLFDGDAVWAVDVRPLAAAPVSAGADAL